VRIKVILTILIVSLLIPLHAIASDATPGTDVNPEDGDVPFSVSERTTPSVDGNLWSLSVEMDQDAYDNGTVFEISTQVCTNDGVCDPPVLRDANVDERMYSVSLTPPSDHTYVNWRIKAVYDDDSSTNFPQGDWYKTLVFMPLSTRYRLGRCSTTTMGNVLRIPTKQSLVSPAGIAVAGVTFAVAFTRRE
jgi:hypothetical protein